VTVSTGGGPAPEQPRLGAWKTDVVVLVLVCDWLPLTESVSLSVPVCWLP
jgi:hypothetical protein